MSPLIVFALALFAAAANAGVIAPVAINSLYTVPNYQSSYSVADALTGDKKSASETRVGDIVKGSYSVVQPDGVVRTVIYTSSPLTGFRAQVINKGKAIHPAIIGGKLIAKAAPAIALVQPAHVVGVVGSLRGVGVGQGHGHGQRG